MGGAILGIEVDFVTGYKGSKERLLSLMRGEFDVTSNSWSSSRAYVEAGDLRLLAQISIAPIANHPALEGIPVLGGPDGIAVKRARALDRNPRVAQTRADALAKITGAGRLIAAPRGLDPALASCLEDAAYEAMTDAEFEAALAKANRPIGATRGAETLRSIRAAIRDIKPFIAAAAE
jgi:tripartite-type tricarboxylate transporter receptor subunit TctC